MASINGLSVKGMKTFLGHEGEPLYQGNLYLNNKKIGFWSQDAHGAIQDNFIMEDGYNEYLLRDIVKKVNADKAHMAGPPDKRFLMEYSLDFLMADYVSLHEDEKMYKSAVKKGYGGIVIASDGYHVVAWSMSQAFMQKNDEDLLKALDGDIQKARKSFMKENKYTKHTVKIYRSPKDFVIGEPIKLEDITRKPKLQDSIDSCEKKSKKSPSVQEKDINDKDVR